MSHSTLPRWAADRAQDLSQRSPQFQARVRFFLSIEGGRTGPVPNGFGCPCVLKPHASEGNDARLLFDEDWTDLGQESVASFYFMGGEDAARKYRDAGKFFLWEGKIVAEAKVL